jgi:hypothetical protein
LRLGSNADSTFASFFKGAIDEVSIYRRALSGGEIAAIYIAGSAGKCRVPLITGQPRGQTATVGSTVTFVVTADGSSSLSYQWQFNSTNIAGATASSLTLTNVQPGQAGGYRVTVTNLAGSSISTVATLTVLQPPVITRQPGDVIAVPGATVNFSVAAKGLAPMTYQWQKNGSPLETRTSATLTITITNIEMTDFASYTVAITNVDGWALSRVAALTSAASSRLQALSFNLATFTIEVPTALGPTYVLEYKDTLDDPSWRVLTTIRGTGLPALITDNGLTNATRFYRVQVR